jgi:hypothetical protein
LTIGQLRNGTKKFAPAMAGGYAVGRYPDMGGGVRRYSGASAIILGGLGLGGRDGRARGRHAAPRRSFLRGMAAPFRSEKVVLAVTMAATLAVGVSGYGVMTASAWAPSALTAKLATVPSGGYMLTAGGALVPVHPGKLLAVRSCRNKSRDASGGRAISQR